MMEPIKLSAWRDTHEPDGFCRTWAATEIEHTIDLARRIRCMATIVGDTGVGKTTALERYAEDDRGAAYCAMDPSRSSTMAVLERLADAMYGHITFQSIARGYDRIVSEMRRIDVLLIDEAQHINDKNLDAVRCIFDESGTAVVLAGNSTLRSRFGNTRKAGFAQVVSRVGARLDLEPMRDDIHAFALHLGADAAAARWLVERAAGDGNLRTVALIVGAARDLVQRATVTRADVERAALAAGLD